MCMCLRARVYKSSNSCCCINNNQIEISNRSYLLLSFKRTYPYTTDNIYGKVIEKGREGGGGRGGGGGGKKINKFSTILQKNYRSK